MTDESLQELWASVLALPGTVIKAEGTSVLTCGSHTGHSWRAIAFCETAAIAKLIADALLYEQARKAG